MSSKIIFRIVQAIQTQTKIIVMEKTYILFDGTSYYSVPESEVVSDMNKNNSEIYTYYTDISNNEVLNILENLNDEL